LSFPLLSLTIWLPILAGFLIIALGDGPARKLAAAASILTLLVSLPLYFGFDSSTAAMQFTLLRIDLQSILGRSLL